MYEQCVLFGVYLRYAGVVTLKKKPVWGDVPPQFRDG